MKQMTIDGVLCSFEKERNVLEVARKNGIDIPNLCYCENLSIYGGCRLCIVEDGRGKIDTACTMIPREGTEVKTFSKKLTEHRRVILEMLLARHRAECTTCEKSGKCKLQEYATRYGVDSVSFEHHYNKTPIDTSSPSIVRDPSKCILCGKCVRACSEIQNVHVLDFANRGCEAEISCGFGHTLSTTKCVGCGQCAAVCPTAAITIKNDIPALQKALFDPDKKVIVQVAPAVRTGIAEEFGLPATVPVMGKITTALKRLGVDVVFDTSLSADLTIVEESNEFMEKLKSGAKLPMFTSCCPAWIKHVENQHPQLMPQVSTCGSPMEMFGAVIQEQYKNENIVSVAVMPCTAKKGECARPELVKDGKRLVDLVITTQELARMIVEAGIDFARLPDSEPDQPFAEFTGGGVIFGVTGGVTEAVIRRVLGVSTGADVAKIADCGVRGLEGTKAFEVTAGDLTLKIAVVNGLANADKLIEKVESGEEFFHFIEVMACPNGCIGGGGQPQASNERKAERCKALFAADDACEWKNCDQNPAMKKVYDLIGDRAHDLLHVHYPAHGHHE